MSEPRKVTAGRVHGAQADGQGGAAFVFETDDGPLHLSVDAEGMKALIGSAIQLVNGVVFEQMGVKIGRLDDGGPALMFQIDPRAWLSIALSPQELADLQSEIERLRRIRSGPVPRKTPHH